MIDSSSPHLDLYMKITWGRIESNPPTQKSNLTTLGKISKIWVLHQFGQIHVKDPTISPKPFLILENGLNIYSIYYTTNKTHVLDFSYSTSSAQKSRWKLIVWNFLLIWVEANPD
jgi:hypothetical protein